MKIYKGNQFNMSCQHLDNRKLTPLERALITLTVAVAGLFVVVNSYDIAVWIWEMMV